MITLRKDTFVCGDIHSDVRDLIERLEGNYFPTKSDIVLLGDAGFWHERDLPFQFFPLIDALEKADCRVLVLRGNHDNPDFFKYGMQTRHFVLLQDLTEVRYGTKLGLVYPGATSIDRYWKSLEMLPGNTYWPDEVVPEPSEVPRHHYDFVLAHTGIRPPAASMSLLSYFSVDDKNIGAAIFKEGLNVEKVMKKTSPEVWVYGHYHLDQEFMYPPTNTKCVVCARKQIKQLPVEWKPYA